MPHETHLSTQQKKASKNLRIPEADENRQRKSRHQSTTTRRPQAPLGLSFPKTVRLRKRSQYVSLSKNGKKFFGTQVVIGYRPSDMAKLGITVPARLGNAHLRNRFKRLVREAFRESYVLLAAVDMNVMARIPLKDISLDGIRKDLQCFYVKS